MGTRARVDPGRASKGMARSGDPTCLALLKLANLVEGAECEVSGFTFGIALPQKGPQDAYSTGRVSGGGGGRVRVDLLIHTPGSWFRI